MQRRQFRMDVTWSNSPRGWNLGSCGCFENAVGRQRRLVNDHGLVCCRSSARMPWKNVQVESSSLLSSTRVQVRTFFPFFSFIPFFFSLFKNVILLNQYQELVLRAGSVTASRSLRRGKTPGSIPGQSRSDGTKQKAIQLKQVLDRAYA